MSTLEITDFRACEQALKLPELKQALYDEGAVLMDRVLVTLHGDEHRARRMTEMRVFRRDFFKRYEQEVIPQIFAEVMSDRASEHIDVVDLGYHFMVYLALAFAGIDRQENTQAELQDMVGMLRMFGVAATLGQAKDRDYAKTSAEVQATLDEFDQRFFTPSAARRQALIERVELGTLSEDDLPMDVLTVLLKDEDKLELVRDMVLRETAFYFLAGAHTSVHSLGHSIHHALTWCEQHPNERERLETDPLRVQRLVHESFRLHPSSPVSKRRALADVELPDGQSAKADDIIIVNLREANHSHEIFGTDSREFNPDRTVQPGVAETGLTFGIGMHACLGKNLAAGRLPTQGKAVELEDHQFGTVAWITHALLRAGIQKDPAQAPELDQSIARETWLHYPALLPMSR